MTALGILSTTLCLAGIGMFFYGRHALRQIRATNQEQP